MEPPSCHSILICNRSGRRLAIHRIRQAVACTLVNIPSSRVEVLLTTDDELQTLNRERRGIDEATDVLTFPAPVFPGAPLGEIAISVETAERQALARGLNLIEELCYLAIHGSLHLCGFDDLTAPDRRKMFRAMHQIGKGLALPDQKQWTSMEHGVSA